MQISCERIIATATSSSQDDTKRHFGGGKGSSSKMQRSRPILNASIDKKRSFFIRSSGSSLTYACSNTAGKANQANFEF